MALTNCPDCGAQVSDSAVVCPQCGFPMRRDALTMAGAGAGGRPGSSQANKVGIILGVAVIGFFVLIFVVGMLAAIAIPRFTNASQRAKEKEGEGLLKQVFTLENAYFANNGTYTASLEELKTVGWAEPDGLRYYTVEVARADSSDLCIHALPRTGAAVQPIRMGTTGAIERGVRCGETAYAADDRQAVLGAMGLADDVRAGVMAWRREHGRLPATETELVEAYPRAADDPDFVIALSPGAAERFCLHIARRTDPPSRPLLSLDGAGVPYAGGECTGTPIGGPGS